jgi:oligosaccharide reducing-end xylanase
VSLLAPRGRRSRPSVSTDRGVASRALHCSALLACVLSTACGKTVDSIGDDRLVEPHLRPLAGPASYPNPARDVLGLSDAEISAKLEATYAQLFHGDPTTEAIYYEWGTDQAYVWDVLHGDVRTEGMALGMLISVELDKRDEFDRLWRYAKDVLLHTSGPNEGFFSSFCGQEDGDPCSDPYGQQQLATALLFAHGRWGSAGDIDYEADTLSVLEALRREEAASEEAASTFVSMFDPVTKLVRDVPEATSLGVTRPSSVMPAYYELWAQATADTFWSDAAASGRSFLANAADASTGLLPLRATFDGAALSGSDTFEPEGYRAQINIGLDAVWFDDPWARAENDRLLEFFFSQGIDVYGRSYTLAGELIDASREPPLIYVNGVTAIGAGHAARNAFIEAAWNLEQPTGFPRYYSGLLHLVSLLALSGNLRVY